MFSSSVFYFWLAAALLCLFSASAHAQLSAAEAEQASRGVVRCRIADRWAEYQLTPQNFEAMSSQAAQAIIDDVLKAAGYIPTVIRAKPVKAGNATICAADDGYKYILYNQQWFDELFSDSDAVWAGRWVIAHELGHFELNHYEKGYGSNIPMELEADRFAGTTLAKMGATLDQALAAFQSAKLKNADAGHTHPQLSARKTAVEEGWRSANPAANVQQSREYVEKGNVFHRNKDYDKAIAEYTKAIEANPKNPVAVSNRGFSYLLKALSIESDEAEEIFLKSVLDFTTAIRLDPKYSLAYFNRGYAYDEAGLDDKAIADYTEAIKIYPGYVEAYMNRAGVYTRKGERDSAIADYTEVIRLAPNDAKPYIQRAHQYSEAERPQNAISDYSRAIQLDSNAYGLPPGQLYMYRARENVKAKQYDNAIADYGKAMELGVQQGLLGGVYISRGETRFLKGDHSAAISDFTTAIQLEPKHYLAYYDRGATYFLQGNDLAAVSDLSRAIELGPAYIKAYEVRAQAYRRIGRVDLAEPDERKVRELSGQQGQ